jgi:hypothetical protein
LNLIDHSEGTLIIWRARMATRCTVFRLRDHGGKLVESPSGSPMPPVPRRRRVRHGRWQLPSAGRTASR